MYESAELLPTSPILYLLHFLGVVNFDYRFQTSSLIHMGSLIIIYIYQTRAKMVYQYVKEKLTNCSKQIH